MALSSALREAARQQKEAAGGRKNKVSHLKSLIFSQRTSKKSAGGGGGSDSPSVKVRFKDNPVTGKKAKPQEQRQPLKSSLRRGLSLERPVVEVQFKDQAGNSDCQVGPKAFLLRGFRVMFISFSWASLSPK